MGTTTNYAIPYPEPTDFVTDGAQAMENIAEQVDAVLQAGTVARNLLYNGAMQVAQRGTSVTSITGGDYRTVDRWYFEVNSAGTWTMAQATSAATDEWPGATTGTFSGFRASAKLTMTSTPPTLISSSQVQLRQLLEGQDLQAIRKGKATAQPVTMSFWVKATKSGTYICELYDADNSRQVSKSYVINATNTWEYKTITFPADTTGMFDNDNALSLYCLWWVSAGSGYTTGTLNTNWGAVTNTNRAVGQVNLADTTNASWQITGVQMTVGSVAPPFQFKSYQQELRECQRYYTRFTGGDTYSLYAIGFARDGASADLVFHAPTTMRRSPTAIDFANLYMTRPGVGTVTITGMSMGDGRSPAIGGVYVTGAFTANQQYFLGNNNNVAGYVGFSAELT